VSELETARRSAEVMLSSDEASRSLGIELLDVGPGRARMRMRVTETMVNGHGIAHGGLVFALADSAFAVACNSHGTVTVASGADVTFVAPGRLGDVLLADADEPDVYLVPSTEWLTASPPLTDRPNVGKKSEPEYGISVARSSLAALERYRWDERSQGDRFR